MEKLRRVAGLVGWLVLAALCAAFELEFTNNEVHFGAPLSKWILLVLLLVATPLLLDLVRRPLCALLRRWERARPEESRLGNDAIRGLGGSTALLALSFLWLAMIDPLDLPHPIALERGADLATIVGAVWLILGLWDMTCQRIATRAGQIDTRAEKLLVPLIRKFVRGMIVVAGGLIALSAFAVDWKGMVAGLGLGGLLVALAAKDSVENLFGSVTILFDMPFQIGDMVKVSGIEGTVEEINLRSTRIRTPEDAVVTLPNSNLIKASVENFGARRKRRVRLTMHVGYQTTTEKLQTMISQVRTYLVAQPWVIDGSVIVEAQDFSESSLSVLVLFFIQVDSYAEEMAHRGEALTNLLAIAEALDVHFLTEPYTRRQPPNPPS